MASVDFRVRGLCQSQLTQIAAEKAKAAAEEYFKLGNIDMAIEQAFAALYLNPKIPLVHNYIAAYLVHKFASRQGLYRKKRMDDTQVLHSILSIEEDDNCCSEATIRKRYKEMALLAHPDKNNSVAADSAFKIVHRAWETLLDKTEILKGI